MLLRVFLVCVLLASAGVSQAGRVETLFQAEVSAADRGSESRDVALRSALEEVLVRVTGGTDSLQTAAVQQLLGQPGRFVEQFRYRETPAEPGESPALSLWVQFDGVALAREVRAAGLPYWGRERPDVLLWLAIDDGGRRYLVSDTVEPAATTARAAGQRYGLPMTLPLMDLEDQRSIGFTDIWGGFSRTISDASRRYRPQVILTGRLSRSVSAGEWRAVWQLDDGAGSQSWKAHADTLDAALATGLAETSAWLAARYAVVSSDSGSRSLVVEGVTGLKDYARLTRYLASLSPVDKVGVGRAEDDEIEFNLKLSADESSLQRLITLGRVLQPVSVDDPWRFRLNP